MAVSQFPSPSNYALHVGDPVGPPCLKLLQLKSERPGIVFKQMVDGGGTYGADTTNQVLRWELTFDGLTSVQAKVLDDHNDSAQDTFLGFSWRDPRTDTLYTDCHYESFERDHLKLEIQARKLVIIKRPA